MASLVGIDPYPSFRTPTMCRWTSSRLWPNLTEEWWSATHAKFRHAATMSRRAFLPSTVCTASSLARRASRRGITTGMSFELSPHMEQLRSSPCDAWLETGKAFARQSAPFDEIKYAKLHARLSDPRLQREKNRLPFFLIFNKGNYRTYEC